MKINTPRKPYKKALLAVSAIVLVGLLGYGAYAVTTQRWPFASSKTVSSSTSTDGNNKNADTATPDSTAVPVGPQQTTSSDTTKPVSPKTPDNTDSPTKPASNELGLTITSIINQDNEVQVRSLIETVTNTGTCTLTFTKGDLTVTKTSGIQALPSSSTCKGFTISHDELPQGTWNVNLKAISGGKTGSDTATFEVK